MHKEGRKGQKKISEDGLESISRKEEGVPTEQKGKNCPAGDRKNVAELQS